MSFSIPTQETARSTLDRVLGVAVSRRIPDEQRRELGLAIAWLQRLVDCGVKACRFDPPIQVMRTGEIDIHNSDPVLHNTHGFYGRRTAFNVALPDQGVKVTRELPRPGMVRVECDAHGWMLAHVFVADSPYYALTGQDGRYAIANIPPGTYALVTSQSYAGDTEQQVTVKAGEAQTLDIMATLDGVLGGAWAAVGKEQLKRLADTLAGWPKDKPVVVFSHNPLYEYYPPWNFWVRDWREVHEVLAPYGNVTNIHGHTHQVLYNEIGRLRSIGMLATSWPWPYAPEGVPVLTRPMVRADPGDHFDGVGWSALALSDAGRVDNEYRMWRKDVFATAPGSETRWVHIGRFVREALGRKSALGETVDRVAAWFVPGVLVLALGTGAYWAGEGGAGPALLAGLAVLVVACPCALGLAAPLATSLGIGRAAEHGILVRGGAVLERLAGARVVAFDKTGTLTVGCPTVVAVDADDVPAAAVLRRAQQLAVGSEHPLARAIAAHAAQAGTCVPAARDIRAFRGAGVTGEVDGGCCAMGSAAFVAERVGPVPPALSAAPLPEGATAVYVAWDGRAHGRLVLVDRLRPEAPAVVNALRARDLHIVLLSGDGAPAVAPLVSLVGIADWHAGLTPEAKVGLLRDATASLGPVAMVSDGLNDGPVLAAAAVGVAVGEATDLANESADVVLPDGPLDLLPWVLQLAEDVRRSVRANLLYAFGYHAIALTLATCGLLRPVVAAALMAGSSLHIVARSLRAGRAAGTAASDGAAVPPAAVPCLGLEA